MILKVPVDRSSWYVNLKEQYKLNNDLRRTWFCATKAYLEEIFVRDRVIFLKEALKAFGFDPADFLVNTLCKKWIYHDKRNRIKIRMQDIKIYSKGKTVVKPYIVFILNDRDQW